MRKELRARPERPTHATRTWPWCPPPSPGGGTAGGLAGRRGLAAGRPAGELALATHGRVLATRGAGVSARAVAG
jgi:hypothetical protein